MGSERGTTIAVLAELNITFKDGVDAARVEFIDLPKEMSKIDALKFMASHASFASPADQATIADALEDRAKEAGKGTVKVKVAKKAKAKPSLATIKARAPKVAAPVTTKVVA